MTSWEEELSKALKEQEEWLEEWICSICGLVFDTEDELDEHIATAHGELEEKAEETLAKIEKKEPSMAFKILKEKLKQERLKECSKRQLRQYEQCPEALEEHAEKELFRLALKHPFLQESEEQLYSALREKSKEQVEDAFARNLCPICNQSVGNLRRHLDEQIAVGETNHKAWDEYASIVMTGDMNKLLQYYKYYPRYRYAEVYPYICPVCGKGFPSKIEFEKHWASEHQIKYGEYKEFTSKKESLSDYKKKEEVRRKKELLFLASALLRKRSE